MCIRDSNYLPKKAFHYLEGCDEIWHGGDIGSINVLEKLEQICLTRAVWGNIDNEIIKSHGRKQSSSSV